MVKNKTSLWGLLNYLTSSIHNNVQSINKSKLFAGLIIITLNIASKFVTIKLSKTVESYLKNTFSKQILVFAIAWMGTRDIYIAIIITTIFTILMEYLLNEDSKFCILPQHFMDYHISLLDNDIVSDEEIKQAGIVLHKAKKQKDTNTTTINTTVDNTTNMLR